MASKAGVGLKRSPSGLLKAGSPTPSTAPRVWQYAMVTTICVTLLLSAWWTFGDADWSQAYSNEEQSSKLRAIQTEAGRQGGHSKEGTAGWVTGELGGKEDACSRVTAVPKVALLFLTRGPMPHQNVWKAWLQAARGLIPMEQLRVAGAGGASGGGGKGNKPVCGYAEEWREGQFAKGAAGAREALCQQFLFSIYVHPAPNFTGYRPDSVFHGLELPVDVRIAPPFWGLLSMLEAELALMRAALADPLNARFQLLSDDTIPLYPPATVYREIMAAPGSHVTACTVGGRNSIDFQGVWPYTLQQGRDDQQYWQHVRPSDWRKSSQWFMLLRQHVQTIIDDTDVDAFFRKLCFSERHNSSIIKCVADEHYIPTALAHNKLEAETTCKGSLIYTDFGRGKGSMHPKSFKPEQVNSKHLQWMRSLDNRCNSTQALRSAANTFVRLADVTPLLLQCAADSPLPKYEPMAVPDMEGPPDAFLPNEATYCVLFSRKFPEDTGPAVFDVFTTDTKVLQVLETPTEEEAMALQRSCRLQEDD